MKKFLFFLFVSSHILCTLGYAQDKSATNLQKDNKSIQLPDISLNFGLSNLMADVALENPGPSVLSQFGYQLSITQQVAKFLNVSFDLYTGSVYGEEQRGITNLNFRTTLFSQHLNIEYNFFPLLKPKENGLQVIRPYIGVGIGMLYFRSKGDLKDGSGNTYQFWSNGNIYAETEGSIPESEATLIERDFEYETELRDADLDGLKKYPQLAFSLPFNAGVRFQLTKHFGLNLGFTYSMNFTDLADNVSPDGTGNRQGKSGNDNHFFGSVGLTFFLGRTKPSVKPSLLLHEIAAADSLEQEKKEIDTGFDTNSSDARAEGDAKLDSNTEVTNLGTTSENEDTTKPKSPEIIKEIIDNQNSTESISGESLEDDVPTIGKDAKETFSLEHIENMQPKPTLNFHWADVNQNGWISPDEVLHFIDLLFEGDGKRDVVDIQNLIDYYFDQE